jgi:hypothetical protein
MDEVVSFLLDLLVVFPIEEVKIERKDRGENG